MITVNTDADSGTGSLRAALAAAADGDTIVFANTHAAYLIDLATVLHIDKSVTIDAGTIGISSVTLYGQVVVDGGADVTLAYLVLDGSTEGASAAAAADGDPGEDRSAGAPGTIGGGAAGHDGEDGGDGTPGETSSIVGVLAGPTLTNNGTLTLDHVTVHGEATGGEGAKGGDGGRGGVGGDGGDGASGAGPGAGGNGGDGGAGGSGGNGTNGGDAVGAITNNGTLTLKDSVISQSTATGGGGGDGGEGGAGLDAGDGAQGGTGTSGFDGGHGGNGGNGGNGGDGGAGGNAGSAVGGIFNLGTVNIVGVALFFGNSAEAGATGQGGTGGEAGTKGLKGFGGFGDHQGADGIDGQSDGTAGGDGAAGAAGTADANFRGSVASGSITVDAHFFDFDARYMPAGQQGEALVNSDYGASGHTLTYAVDMWGDAAVSSSVSWHVVTGPNGPLPGDFTGPTLGTLTFTADDDDPYRHIITLQLKANVSLARELSFTIVLDTPGGGDTLGSTSSLTQDIVDTLLPLLGDGGDNTLTGTSAYDTIKGLGGNDKLYGLDGNDVLVGGAGGDRLDGGTHSSIFDVDTASYEGAAAGVTASLADPGKNKGDAAGDSYFNINALLGSSHNDVLAGDGGANTITGGAGADAMAGGKGNDRYYVDNTGDTVTEASGGGTDVVYSAVSFTLGSNVETLVLQGTGKINASGSSGANTLLGNSAANKLTGNGGNDTIYGAGGADSINGGSGADQFIYYATADSTAAHSDAISGWDKSDLLGLAGIDANAGKTGIQHFVWDGKQSSGHTLKAGHIEWYQSGSNTIVRAAVDGSHSHDLQIEILGKFTLTSHNFDLV